MIPSVVSPPLTGWDRKAASEPWRGICAGCWNHAACCRIGPGSRLSTLESTNTHIWSAMVSDFPHLTTKKNQHFRPMCALPREKVMHSTSFPCVITYVCVCEITWACLLASDGDYKTEELLWGSCLNWKWKKTWEQALNLKQPQPGNWWFPLWITSQIMLISTVKVIH